MKTGPTPSVPPKTSPGAQNIETRPDALGNVQNDSGRGKRDPTPSVTPKMSLGAQNMKMGTDALCTTENESGRTKHENSTRRPRYRRKRVKERKILKKDLPPSAPPKMSPGEQI
jgi:hypothetical protein